MSGSLIDDMGGLYSHASEAVQDGKRTGRQEMFAAAHAKLSALYSKAEREEVPVFHAFGEALRALNDAQDSFQGPRKERP
jgi:hypothetical protein